MTSVTATVMGAIAFVSAGPVLILLNKHILTQHDFPFPIALSALGVCATAAITRAIVATNLVQLKHPTLTKSNTFYATTALPLAALSALTLALGNAAYIHLGVGMCQMLKSTTPTITLLMLRLLGLEKPSAGVVGCVLLICVGTAVAARGELAISRIGVALQLSANLAEALRITASQRLMSSSQQRQLPLLELTYHVAPLQAACLVAASAALELREPAAAATALRAAAAAPYTFAAASVLGFALQLTSLFVIQAFGSLTMKLLTICRNGALVLFQAARGAESFHDAQIAGHALSTAAFVGYTMLKMRSDGAQKSLKKE